MENFKNIINNINLTFMRFENYRIHTQKNVSILQNENITVAIFRSTIIITQYTNNV